MCYIKKKLVIKMKIVELTNQEIKTLSLALETFSDQYDLFDSLIDENGNYYDYDDSGKRTAETFEVKQANTVESIKNKLYF
ncbi:hypothetical protein BSQ39_08350 [Loigolactobacillus backii]|nr:hypothetical protein AYR52_04835 [Loigolactobacillus backii]ANK64630.1 hypothetical protein AYR54_04850 [Loigolactobacillus backii]ANK66974.1 hypothetical protein AYR55_04190 [Loigolactobacillus backii]OLF68713.1 hypothetical protein ACX53_11360 [Loigolactobacillus backii]PIO83572.1 hypothetical protein BSQ39_08350 [Loigolactobacillus backii]